MFNIIKQKVANKFSRMSLDSTLYQVEVDRELIWELYLNGFDPAIRQEHNCNCCKSFLRQFAGIVSIKNNKIVTMFDEILQSEPYYGDAILAVRQYIESLPISNVFGTTVWQLGTDRSRDGELTWYHFSVKADKHHNTRGQVSVEAMQSITRSNKEVLKRSFDEILPEALSDVLSLIEENALYRGVEHRAILNAFQDSQKVYLSLPEAQKDNYCWSKQGEHYSKIRNHAIGKLLVDLSEGKDLEHAVRAFETMVAPTNWKRTTALVSPGMITKAESVVKELGYTESLERRYANTQDVMVTNTLFVDRSSSLKGNAFESIKEEVLVDQKKLRMEEIKIGDFLSNVLPTAKAVHVLVEGRHQPNFVSLTAPVNKDSKSMFKWANGLGWSYAGAVTDSIKEKVKAAGGNTEGFLRVSLSWHNTDDLDLHVHEPNGRHIYFGDKRSSSTGTLDVDMNYTNPYSKQAVENVVWTDKSKFLSGEYRVVVNNYTMRQVADQGFTVELEYEGQVYTFESAKNVNTLAFRFNYEKGELSVQSGTTTTKLSSKKVWNVNTNQWTKVRSIMLSPNYWGYNPIGNKHYMFMLENCVSDEAAKPFFNEFLAGELYEHRKVFELLANKIQVSGAENQLSGLGFSETQPNKLIVKVKGESEKIYSIHF